MRIYKRRLVNYRNRAKDIKFGSVLPYIILFGVVYFFKDIVNLMLNFGGSKQEFQDTTASTNNVSYNQSNLTLSDNQANIIISSLVQAMGYMLDGTDEQTIYNQFSKIKTPDDMRFIFKKFGVRLYGSGYFFNNKLNLIGWLNEEMSEGDLAPIQEKLNWI